MTALPRPAGLVDGEAAEMHTQRPDERPIIGSSEGAAAREARATAQSLLLRLITSKEDPRAALDDAAFEIGRLIELGHLDRAEMGDALRAAAIRAELVLEDGEDAVQEVIASGFKTGKRASDEERAEQEEREAAARAADPWNDPDLTLLEDRRGDLPAFPVDALPQPWRPWLERAARGAGVMPDHVAMPLLAVSAGLIGAARRVRASRSWSEPICLWTPVIGFSGTGKTPGLDVVRRVLSRIERSRSDSIDAQRAAHEKKAAEAKAALRRWKKEVEAATKASLPAPDQPKEAGVRPHWR